MAGRVFAVGVGPGAPGCVTEEAARAISASDVIIGHSYTLATVAHLTAGKDVREVNMSTQEEAYRSVLPLGERSLAVPFTGDVSFSESEVVDRLTEIFGEVELVPGISAVQVAAARTRIPLDKSRVITMHVTGPIEGKKGEMRDALSAGLCVFLVPRPWPSRPDLQFMPSDAARYLREGGLETSSVRASVFERLTTESESRFDGTVRDLEGMEFSDMCVAVLGSHRPDSYANYRWQWERG